MQPAAQQLQNDVVFLRPTRFGEPVLHLLQKLSRPEVLSDAATRQKFPPGHNSCKRVRLADPTARSKSVSLVHDSGHRRPPPRKKLTCRQTRSFPVCLDQMLIMLSGNIGASGVKAAGYCLRTLKTFPLDLTYG